MPTLAPQERLQPALLDRLVDDTPEKSQERREDRLITSRLLREAVLRDLEWLLNAAAHSEEQLDPDEYPLVAKSVINFGLPPLSGETASTLDPIELERRIRTAIANFEPRILPGSLKVQALLTDSTLDQHNLVQIQIAGRLWAEPVPLEILMRTEMDLETGDVQVRDISR